MPAKQTHALLRNPNALDLTDVATYDRLVGARLERVWENVLDWEHLPHLHDASFSYCELDEVGEWGWRTWSNPERTDHIELCVGEVDYVARTYVGNQQVSEIWTTLTPEGGNTRIKVEFLIAGVPPDSVADFGAAMLALYTRLWDEDEAMMEQRQQRLDEPRASDTVQDLGQEADVRAALPLTFQCRRQEYTLQEIDGALTAIPSICPHLLGPLELVDESAKMLRCPWHGYQFERASRACVEPVGARCRLPPSPSVRLESGRVIASIN